MVNVGDVIKIQNGFVRTFYGERVLDLGTDGRITALHRKIGVM